MTAEYEVREASNHNAVAMNQMLKGDASLISSVWSHAANVTVMHPVGTQDVGWDAVQASFENFSALASEGTFELQHQSITVTGDIAVEMGTEHARGKLGGHAYDIQPRVTNIYAKQAGGWKMIHHHSEVDPSIVEVLGRLQAH